MLILFTAMGPVSGTGTGIQEFQNVKENKVEQCQRIRRVSSEDGDSLSIKLGGIVKWKSMIQRPRRTENIDDVLRAMGEGTTNSHCGL